VLLRRGAHRVVPRRARPGVVPLASDVSAGWNDVGVEVLDTDSEDDEEDTTRHTLDRGMTWARRAFDELILPATSVSFLVKDSFSIPRSSRASPVISVLLGVDA
jgi:hypothetical protein